MRIFETPSVNYDDRPDGAVIEYLIFHYTAVDLETSLKFLQYSKEPHRVSCHYLICEEGHIYKLVEEKYRAWHAGVSAWGQDFMLNAQSIGIELVNPGHGPDYHPFTSPQMTSLIELSKDIIARNNISPFNILGHSDIAPVRKQDPGELFDWQQMADHGIGIMPPADLETGEYNEKSFLEDLLAYGYSCYQQEVSDPLPYLEKAFQMHFGGKTREQMAARLSWLVNAKQTFLSTPQHKSAK